MKKILMVLLFISSFVLIGAGCNNQSSKIIETQQKQIEELSKQVEELSKKPIIQKVNPPPAVSTNESSTSITELREECKTEVQNKFDTFDKIIEETKPTREQAMNLARRAGITDENNYVKDRDILIKDCVEKKKEIWK